MRTCELFHSLGVSFLKGVPGSLNVISENAITAKIVKGVTLKNETLYSW